uniref:Uncharacterized protein n=1 Tax=Arundo donax TaxID=35708 RepID=A0A0A9AGV7_ARUDO
MDKVAKQESVDEIHDGNDVIILEEPVKTNLRRPEGTCSSMVYRKIQPYAE